MHLKGKKVFIAGVGDDQGYAWPIAKKLYEAGAKIYVGTWAPILNIFETSWRNGKFDESRKLPDGSLFEIEKIYPMDASFDYPQDVPEEIRENKRYKALSGYTLSEVKATLEKDIGHIDILIHAVANGPEVKKPLLETSRAGYLAAISSSSYSFVSMVQQFGSMMKPGSAALNLTYIASERVVPGYGGGMSSAKAALESDTRTLAFEAGRKYGIRVNSISAGPWKSRAAKAIGFIGAMVEYSKANAPLTREFLAEDVANAATFICSPLAAAITGVVLYVDNGLHAMGLALDSPTLTSTEE